MLGTVLLLGVVERCRSTEAVIEWELLGHRAFGTPLTPHYLHDGLVDGEVL
jgi:hypothetical protein